MKSKSPGDPNGTQAVKSWAALIRFLLAIEIATAGLLLSCASLQFEGLGYDYHKETFVSSIPDDSTRTYWLKTIRFFEAIDDSFAQQLEVLNLEKDRAKIDSLIQAYRVRKEYETRPDTPDKNEWWEEMWGRRAAHCDTLYPIETWDSRAIAVLKHGIPDDEFGAGEFGGDSKPTSCPIKYHLHWWKKQIFLGIDCHERIVQDSQYFGFVLARTERVQMTRGPVIKPFPEVKEVIETALDVVSFPERDSFAVWVSSGVGVNQCKPDSTGSISYHMETVLYSTDSAPKVIRSDTGSSIVLPVPDTTKKALAEIWYPAYVGDYRLPAGKYDLFITVRDEHAADHLGVYKKALILPSPQASLGMSDILIALKPAEKTHDGVSNRIIRGDKTLMGNPTYYHRGDTLYPYLEFAVDRFTPNRRGEYEYTMLASLYPAKEGLKSTQTEIGKVLEVLHDTLDVATAKLVKKRPRTGATETLIYSSSSSTHLPRVSFQAPMVIPRDLSAGKYFLVISAQDSHSRKYLTAWRTVGIRK